MVTTRPELWGTFGMVSSTHYLATAAGMAVLEGGGNAADAAATAGFVLQVVEPHLNGPGGDMSLLTAGPDGLPRVLCGQGVAPAAATIEHYRDLGLDLVPGSGPLAAAVPGATPAWFRLCRETGTLDPARILGPAAEMAEHGVPVLPTIARTIAASAEMFRSAWPSSAATWLSAGAPPESGSVLCNPELAATYRQLLAAAAGASTRDGRWAAVERAWSQGFVAEAIERFARQPLLDSSGQPHAGVITGADLAGWTPTWEEPATAGFGDWTLAKTGPWGQGPVLLSQLRMLELLGIDGLGADGTDDPARLHTILEVTKLAFADRDAWFGDTAEVPLAALLADDYLTDRVDQITDRADEQLRPGRPGGAEPRLADFRRRTPGGTAGDLDAGDRTGLGEPTVGRPEVTRGDTCHVDVVDRWGNSVAAMPSGGWLQSSPVVPGLGFPLGSRLQMTSLEPGLPASLRPGRRPRTTLSPSMALRDGRVELAFGTPGGDQQDQWQLWFFLRVAGGAGLQEAMDAPGLHSEHFPSSFYPREAFPAAVVAEDRWPAATRAELTGRGHRIQTAPGWSLGRMCAVRRERGSAVLRAAADARGAQAYAAGG